MELMGLHRTKFETDDCFSRELQVEVICLVVDGLFPCPISFLRVECDCSLIL